MYCFTYKFNVFTIQAFKIQAFKIQKQFDTDPDQNSRSIVSVSWKTRHISEGQPPRWNYRVPREL